MRFTNKIPFVIAFFLLTVPLFARTYSTTFPATENPISEGGNWTSGSAAGTCGGSLCYYNFRTTQGFAFGTMPVGVGARDSTAILTGSWGLNQTITATAHWTNFTAGELELRLRSSLVAGGYSYGYEVLFAEGYCQIVRWEGQVATLGGGAYTFLFNPNVGPCSKVPSEGSTLKATAVSTDGGTTTTITAWIDGVQIMTVKDSGQGSNGSSAINDSFCSTHVCNPGMGSFINTGTNSSSNFGFSSYTATDGVSTQPPAAPTGLTATVS